MQFSPYSDSLDIRRSGFITGGGKYFLFSIRIQIKPEIYPDFVQKGTAALSWDKGFNTGLS
jgi:hypothetical protein